MHTNYFLLTYYRDPEEAMMAEQEKKRIKNLKKKLRRQQKQGIWEDLKNSPLLNSKEKQEILTNAGSKERLLMEPLDDARKAIEKDKDEKIDPGKSVESPADETVVEREGSGSKKDIHKSSTKAQKVKKVCVDEVAHGDMQTQTKVLKCKKENLDARTKIKMTKKKPVDAGTDGMKKSPVKVFGKRKHDTVNLPTKIKKKQKKSNEKATDQVLPGVSDARLAAYGQNPKHLKRKAKYGKGNLEGKISATFVQ